MIPLLAQITPNAETAERVGHSDAATLLAWALLICGVVIAALLRHIVVLYSQRDALRDSHAMATDKIQEARIEEVGEVVKAANALASTASNLQAITADLREIRESIPTGRHRKPTP